MSASELKSTTPSSSVPNDQERIFLVSYPKIVFLWPTFAASIIAGVYMLFAGPPVAVEKGAEMGGQAIVGWLFLVTLSVNMVVLSFDFPRATSLIIFFVLVAIGLGLWLLGVKFPTVLPVLGDWISAIQPRANATFYTFFATVLLLIYLGVAVNARFDYWEVRPNELLHHHGFLSDLERFSAPQLKIDKEIGDIFEYLLLGAGRLILHPSNERRSIVLENVLWISRKEKAITKMLGALQVQVRQDTPV